MAVPLRDRRAAPSLRTIVFFGEINAKPERVFGELVSPDYFSMLGVKAQRGRMLSAALDRPGDAPVSS